MGVYISVIVPNISHKIVMRVDHNYLLPAAEIPKEKIQNNNG